MKNVPRRITYSQSASKLAVIQSIIAHQAWERSRIRPHVHVVIQVAGTFFLLLSFLPWPLSHLVFRGKCLLFFVFILLSPILSPSPSQPCPLFFLLSPCSPSLSEVTYEFFQISGSTFLLVRTSKCGTNWIAIWGNEADILENVKPIEL